MTKPQRSAFTLLELLVVIAIIAVLAGLLMPVFGRVKRHANQTACLSNMRQVAACMLSYAGEHDSQLPGRVKGASGTDRWPRLIAPYVQDTKILAAPGDPQNFIARNADPLSNSHNNTSYILNGFNDLGTFDQPNMEVKITSVESPSRTLILGMPKPGSAHFFMDFLEPPHGNSKDVLNLKVYGDGSNYVFADGSARFIKEADYRDSLWLADKAYVIPNL